jgi:phage shock protein PspC (stress-responsive transcriptional regulator)
MNKTININLSGIIFHLDEDAYNLFKSYLTDVKNALESQEGREEIILDIEARIAELFNARLEQSKHQVITIDDVNFICDTLGAPNDFKEEDENNKTHQKETKSKKRLFRNPDEKVIGGVSSGIGAYFRVNIIWIRVIFLLLLFTTGIGLLSYIILWAVIPQAKTTAQKLQMKGEPVNLSNIEKSVKEELNGVKERFGKFRNENKGNKNSFVHFLERIANFILQVFERVIKFIFNFFNITLIIFASILGFVLFMMFFGILAGAWNVGNSSIVYIDGNLLGLNAAEALLGEGIDLTLIRIGTLLVLLLPILSLITLISKALGKTLIKSKLFNVIGGISFFIGIAFVLFVGGQVANSFKVGATEVRKINLIGDVFNIEADLLESNNGFLFELDDQNLTIDNVSLQIKKSKDSTAILMMKHKARGKNNSEARQRAHLFDYPIEQNGEYLILNDCFSVPKEALYRGQELRLTLYLPVGTEIFLDPSIENLIFDIENVHNIWNGNMVGHTWRMSEKGLICLDCEEIEYFDESEIEDTKEIQLKIKNLESEIERLKKTKLEA